MAFERRGLGAHLVVPALHALPVPARARHERRGPLRLGDHPAVLGLDRHGHRALGGHDGVVPAPAQVLHAGQAREGHPGHDEQTLGQADVGGPFEQLARLRHLAARLQQPGLERQQHVAAARGGRVAIPEPAVEHRVRLVDAPFEGQPVGERRRREQRRAGVAGHELDRALRPLDGVGAAQPRAGHERAPLRDRRRQPGIVAAVLPGPLEQLLGGVEITGEDREVRPDAVAARAGRDGRLLGEPAGGAAVAGVEQRLDRVQRQALALGRLGGDAPRGEQEPDRADPGTAGALLRRRRARAPRAGPRRRRCAPRRDGAARRRVTARASPRRRGAAIAVRAASPRARPPA